MAKGIRRRLYTFARGLARPFTDRRRPRFLTDMLPGLVIAGPVHLTKIARALSPGHEDIHAVDKRLSRHLASEPWDRSPFADRLVSDSAAWVTADTILTAALTDVAK